MSEWRDGFLRLFVSSYWFTFGFNMRKEGIVNLINVIRILNYEFRFCLQIVQNYINMTSDAFR